MCITRANKAHTGVYLAARIAECLRDYGIQDKVIENIYKLKLLT
jgi:hypothetical protein